MAENRLPKKIMNYRPIGKRDLGRPRKRWLDDRDRNSCSNHVVAWLKGESPKLEPRLPVPSFPLDARVHSRGNQQDWNIPDGCHITPCLELPTGVRKEMNNELDDGQFSEDEILSVLCSAFKTGETSVNIDKDMA
ncbi:hypothetical protein ANN_10709 [Periplaneta americana]|uniref:Uncharacterized protein n=1 Tax=Periplaneta americana TaxID=6978 RepID=A0ABQ8T323_PERAM|nr:hypothetical protein ANN_10709 [Periplaneta americana]